MFVQRTWVRAERHPAFPSAALIQAEASTGLFKSLGAKEFENETRRTMGTAKGQGPTACSALPRKSLHPAGQAGGVGNPVFKRLLDPH